MKSAKRFLSILLTLSMVLGLLPMSAFAAKNNTPFTDVSTGDWFYESVEYVYECGMMSGTSETTFSPQTTTTRGMIVTILHRMEGTPEAAGVAFNDVDELAYYADAVAWASENEIVTGYGNSLFGPNDSITREQMAAILYRFAQYLGMDVSVGEDTNILSYSDAEQVSEWAVEALHWAVGMGLINGIDGNLVPQGSATRAQVATILMRFCEGGVVAEDTHTVTFQYNYGSKGVYQEIQVADGDAVDKPDNPDRKNHTFKGWYTAKSGGEKYNFNLPVTEDITLWAKWKKVEIEAENPSEIDSDKDALSDAAEGFIGTDPQKEDTDGDGLSDSVECIIATEPTEVDTDGNGVLDGDEDSDGDGLTNLEDIQFGIDPAEDDSDHDGLNDYEEVITYGTHPLKSDSDADGAIDGWEVAHGFDPLVANTTFEISSTIEDGDISATVDINVSGNQIETLRVLPVKDNALISKEIPGYIGTAFDFSVEGSFDEATISFTFDEKLLQDPSFDPVIYYFNEETQVLEELSTEVSGNIASAKVSHFSSYILLNKTTFESVWNDEIKPPVVDEDGSLSNIDVVFVIDCSGSMYYNSRMSTAKAALHTFLNALAENDRAGLVKFTESATTLSNLTVDKNSVDAMVNSLSASGMTAMYTGFSQALDLLSANNEKYGYKMIIILSDGVDEPSTTYNGYYSDLVERAVANNVVVYTIGAGTSVDTSILTKVAQKTGGAYYAATKTQGITDAFDKIQEDTVDLTTDSNNDRIPDYFTEKLCDGSLKIGTGKDNPFYTACISFETIQADVDGDYDNDGLLNGQELVVKYNEKTKRVYVWMMSDPTVGDADYDGIEDDHDAVSAGNKSNVFNAAVSYTTGGNQYNFDAEFTVDYRLFFGDNTKYNKELATLASLFALDMYSDGYLTFSQGLVGNTKEGNGTEFGSLFGLQDCVNINATALGTTYAQKSNGALVDSDDVSEVFFGHKPIAYNGEQREVIFLMVRGTNATQAEWSSNFDIGTTASEYTEMTGAHPDWTNKENHKGFDVAATRILRAYAEYISDLEARGKIDPSLTKSIFISGHSRGGGIANLLGAHFEGMSGYEPFTYTMAAPNTTTAFGAGSKSTIFNIVNEDDLVTYLPLNSWQFSRFGRDVSVSVKDDGYEDFHPTKDGIGTYEATFNKEYNSNNNLLECLSAFYYMSKGRSDFYVLDYTSGDGQIMEGVVHFSDDTFLNFENLLTVAKMDKYCEYNKNLLYPTGYTIDVTYCPAYAAQNIADLAAVDDIRMYHGSQYDVWSLLGIDLKGKYADARREFVLASGKIPAIGGVTGGMESPHMPGTYCLIAQNYEWN